MIDCNKHDFHKIVCRSCCLIDSLPLCVFVFSQPERTEYRHKIINLNKTVMSPKKVKLIRRQSKNLCVLEGNSWELCGNYVPVKHISLLGGVLGDCRHLRNKIPFLNLVKSHNFHCRYFFTYRWCIHIIFYWRRNPTKTLGFLLPWISPGFGFDFLLSPALCIVVSKKTKVSCFGGFFPWFLKPSNSLVFVELLTSEIRTK